MEIPDLVRDRLGGEEIQAGVNIGDEDALLVTPTRTIVYHGEGLLSDESVEVYPHDLERLSVSDGRRKTTFDLQYVDGTESFAVPAKRADTVLELVMQGVLRVAGVSGPEESVRGVYRFSELTVVVTDARLVKHVGAPIWDDDFEEFPFEAVTGLEFEAGSVATQIVVWVDGRPQRIKAPSDQAGVLRQTLEDALFGFHGVRTLEELNETLEDGNGGPAQPGGEDRGSHAGSAGEGGDLGLDSEIAPLVGEDEPDGAGGAADAGGGEGADAGARPNSIEIDPTGAAEASTETGGTQEEGAGGAGSAPAADAGGSAAAGSGDRGPPADADSPDEGAPTQGPATSGGGPAAEDLATRAELQDLAAEVTALRETVDDQAEVLERQHEAIKQLVAELRRER